MTVFSHATTRARVSSLGNCSVINKVVATVVSVDTRAVTVAKTMYLMECLDSSNVYCYWVTDNIYESPTDTVPQFTGTIRNQSIVRRL